MDDESEVLGATIMSIQNEFSKFADHYGSYNIIQRKVAKALMDPLKALKPQRLLDLGCGSGLVYREIDWPLQRFSGVDFSSKMLQLHPKDDHVECMLGDFNDSTLFERLDNAYDFIVSASALQWSEDLDVTLGYIAALEIPVAFAIFTSGTFFTLYETAQLPPLLRTAQEVIETAQKHFTCKCEIRHYNLEFETTQELFRYIKRSGVSGSRNVLSFRAIKNLMATYPKKSLEFEVVFIRS